MTSIIVPRPKNLVLPGSVIRPITKAAELLMSGWWSCCGCGPDLPSDCQPLADNCTDLIFSVDIPSLPYNVGFFNNPCPNAATSPLTVDVEINDFTQNGFCRGVSAPIPYATHGYPFVDDLDFLVPGFDCVNADDAYVGILMSGIALTTVTIQVYLIVYRQTAFAGLQWWGVNWYSGNHSFTGCNALTIPWDFDSRSFLAEPQTGNGTTCDVNDT